MQGILSCCTLNLICTIHPSPTFHNGTHGPSTYLLRWVGLLANAAPILRPPSSFSAPSKTFLSPIPGTPRATAPAYSSRLARTTPPAPRAACPTPAENESLPPPPAPSTHRRDRTAPATGCPPPKEAPPSPASLPAPSEPPAVPTHCKISPRPRTRTRKHAASLPPEASFAAPAARSHQYK